VTVEEGQPLFGDSARRHWEYVREAVRDGRDEASWIHLTVRDYLAAIGFHYVTAMEHGYKHGVHDCSTPTKREKEE